MIVLRIFTALAIIYLSWVILPFVLLFSFPFIVSGKVYWTFHIGEWVSLFTGLFLAWGFWIITREYKKQNIVFLSSVVFIVLLVIGGVQYNHYQKQIMGYEPMEAAKNVILKFDSDAPISSYDFVETDRWYPETSYPDKKSGQIVKYNVKYDSIIIYKVSVIQVKDRRWHMFSHQEIRN